MGLLGERDLSLQHFWDQGRPGVGGSDSPPDSSPVAWPLLCLTLETNKPAALPQTPTSCLGCPI